jgi:hypothetical protein
VKARLDMLADAVGGRPCWQLLPTGEARYDSPTTGRVALLGPLSSTLWQYAVYPDAHASQYEAKLGGAMLQQAIVDAESRANRPRTALTH